MILLIPISPEVTRPHAPKLWPALTMVVTLGLAYLMVQPIVYDDLVYVSDMGQYMILDQNGQTTLSEEGHSYLRKRPLLRISPSKGDWSPLRLGLANFIHGSTGHLLLNLIGVFAGARICATFIPFAVTSTIFLLGGSFGLLASILLSSEVSPYIPHVGASGGIFALMGTYYVYNFAFRTRYFFWFPSRHGLISLRTSWFFFVDVILLEVILTAAQLLPNRIDSVDHIAHVVGFTSGVAMAFLVRKLQRWPGFLQTRDEFDAWRKLIARKPLDLLYKAFVLWCELLHINAYNDQVKKKLFELLCKHPRAFNDLQISLAFCFLSPTFIRLHAESAADCIASLLACDRKLPRDWLARTPYDSIIRIAQKMATPAERQHLLFTLVSQYRRAHPEGGDIERKLELLTQRLSGLITPPRAAKGA